MLNTCFYFQVHQPFRLRDYSVFDIGTREDYFDDAKNAEIVRKVATKCYLPMNQLLLESIARHAGRFRFAFSISGTVLDQLQRWSPETLKSFQRLVDTGCVELLAETYYHSLAFVFDRHEFDRQVALHSERMESTFGVRPSVFRNTELIFNNELAAHVAGLGFTGVLAEGVDRLLGWRSPNFVYHSPSAPELPVLLKNHRLSDDIAFRFGDRGRSGDPLTADIFASWLEGHHGNGNLLNLFMDYETFGEHQWADTGIFEFMRHLPSRWLERGDNAFVTPTEAVAAHEPVAEFDAHEYTSWADEARDLTAWLGNEMQTASQSALYDHIRRLREGPGATPSEALARLTTSDHAYYMCTKWFADGDVHEYFSPYESPYEAYIAFMNVMNDQCLRHRRATTSVGGTVVPAESPRATEIV